MGSVLLVLGAILAAGCGRADEPAPGPRTVVLADDSQSYLLGRYLDILEDPTRSLTFDQVRSDAYREDFLPSTQETPNLGFSSSAFWLRFEAANRTSARHDWVLAIEFPNLNYVDLYLPSPDRQGYVVRRTGAYRLAASRDLEFPGFIYLIQLEPGQAATYFVRVETGSSVTLPLTLWDEEAFGDYSRQAALHSGIFYGAILVMAAMNLLLYLSLREKSYLFLVLFLASALAAFLVYEGWADLLLPVAQPGLRRVSLAWSIACMGLTMLIFTDSFFGLRERKPRLRRRLVVLEGAWVVAGVAAVFLAWGATTWLVAPMLLLSSLAVIEVGVRMWRSGYRASRLYLAAWGAFAISLAVIVLARVGILQSVPFFEHSYRPGVLLLVTLWSLALASRITESRTEAHRAGERLRLSEARLAQILDAMPVGVAVYGPDGRMAYRNPRAREIVANPTRGPLPANGLGRMPSEAARDSSFRIAGTNEPYPEDQLPGVRALQGEKTSRDDIEAVLGDRRVPLEVWATPVPDPTGQGNSAIVAFQDITQRRQTEDELRQFRQQLESLVLARTAELTAANARLNREMAEREELEQSIHQRAEWMSVFARIAQSLVRVDDLSAALDQLVREAPRFTGAREAAIFLLTGQSELRLAAASAAAARLGSGLGPDQVAEPDQWRRFQAGEVLVRDIRPEGSPLRLAFPSFEVQMVTLTPITVGQDLRGALALAPKSAIADGGDATIAREVAADVGQLIEKVGLLREAEALLAAEARTGLARDLHDSVTQVLFSASLVAEILPQVWRRNVAEGERALLEVRRLNRAALAEMRSLLLELRPASILAAPLSELMSQLVEAVTSRSEMDFELYIEPMATLPDEVHIVFYRIAQEAMNNVVKHSGASRVRLTLRAIPPWNPDDPAPWQGTVGLEVFDNGKGISPEGKPTGPFSRGLAIMRERAQGIQADLSVRSTPGVGTTVVLRWPAGGSNDAQ